MTWQPLRWPVLFPNHPRLVELAVPALVGKSGEPSHTSLLVHGTWARSSPWWQPGGNFHSYLLNNVRNDLYNNGQDIFSWSGGYSHAAYQLGSQDLINWVNTHQIAGLNHLFTHSHGGSVAMLASQGRFWLLIKLILLSCPVHSQYMPDFNGVGSVSSIHVRCDLVILADRGGQKYNHPQIQEACSSCMVQIIRQLTIQMSGGITIYRLRSERGEVFMSFGC